MSFSIILHTKNPIFLRLEIHLKAWKWEGFTSFSGLIFRVQCAYKACHKQQLLLLIYCKFGVNAAKRIDSSHSAVISIWRRCHKVERKKIIGINYSDFRAAYLYYTVIPSWPAFREHNFYCIESFFFGKTIVAIVFSFYPQPQFAYYVGFLYVYVRVSLSLSYAMHVYNTK